MHKVLAKIKQKIRKLISFGSSSPVYDFNKSNPLGGNGERVDIQLDKQKVNYDELDMYQKNHWRRYEYALEIINQNDVCGDFACGTGYGSILLSSKAKFVTGLDLDAKVISSINQRYEGYKNVEFLNGDILKLEFTDHFDSIVSFETLEHFEEENIEKLFKAFHKALKKNGMLIFSTPYMQVKSDEAIRMGFHLTFYINEEKIRKWLDIADLKMEVFRYQNYDSHIIEATLLRKDFVICHARKN